MSLSSFCLLLGTFVFLLGLPVFFGDERHFEWRRAIVGNRERLRAIVTGIVAIAAVTLKLQWRFTPDAEGGVVIVAWIVLVLGIVAALWPGKIGSLALRWLTVVSAKRVVQVFCGGMMIVLGAVLGALGLLLAS